MLYNKKAPIRACATVEPHNPPSVQCDFRLKICCYSVRAMAKAYSFTTSSSSCCSNSLR